MQLQVLTVSSRKSQINFQLTPKSSKEVQPTQNTDPMKIMAVSLPEALGLKLATVPICSLPSKIIGPTLLIIKIHGNHIPIQSRTRAHKRDLTLTLVASETSLASARMAALLNYKSSDRMYSVIQDSRVRA